MHMGHHQRLDMRNGKLDFRIVLACPAGRTLPALEHPAIDEDTRTLRQTQFVA